MIDLKEFPDDYAQTLSRWRYAFFAQKDAVPSMGKDESFLRRQKDDMLPRRE